MNTITEGKIEQLTLDWLMEIGWQKVDEGGTDEKH